MAETPTPYWDYIEVESLLSLQTGIGDSEAELSNDEVMFIVVHQIDELWFKLVLREMVAVRNLFARAPVPEQALASAVRGIRRMETILHQLAAHFALMETMTTRDYLGFRDKLTGASGFQSAQLREIEIVMGLNELERVPLGPEGSYLTALKEPDGSESSALKRVRARLGDRPSLREAVLEWIHRTPIQGSTPSDPDDAERVRAFAEAYLATQRAAVERGLTNARKQSLTANDVERLEKRAAAEIASARAYLLGEDGGPGEDGGASAGVGASASAGAGAGTGEGEREREEARARRSRIRCALVFIESYRELPLLAWPREVIDGLTSFEQAFVIFRQRHARMVERMIGRRTGTGGSAGVDYLDTTALRYRVFRELWAVRTLLVRAQDLPPLECPELYGFAVGV